MKGIKSFITFLILLFNILISVELLSYDETANSITCNGVSTYLEIKILSYPKYDKSPGETLLTLHSVKDSSILKEHKLEGNWHCIGYNIQDKKYILGGMFQVGAWLPMCEIRYLDEDNYELKPSRINNTDWFSFISVPDESGKYLALIGKYDEKYMVMYVLNTVTDRVQVLGKPPQPPPVDSSFINDDMLKESWQWGCAYADGFTEMDNGIIVFEKNDKLRVSIGKDSPLRRAVKRKNVVYKLIK
ncbi:MAG: hypothetical protein M1419_10455 [Bacteroidetes bacterium]|nr:hypothetical protein [Bacteroidota bacterium]